MGVFGRNIAVGMLYVLVYGGALLMSIRHSVDQRRPPLLAIGLAVLATICAPLVLIRWLARRAVAVLAAH